jgi:hypothetical protein
MLTLSACPQANGRPDRQGAQGTFDAAAKNLLSSEFVKEDGSSYKDSEVEDEAIKVILTKGNLQTSDVSSIACRQEWLFRTCTNLKHRCPNDKESPTTPRARCESTN